jgi:hypothetical protein
LERLTITLGSANADQLTALATALLGGKTPAEFLAAGDTITSAYTATIVYENATIELDGSLNFTVTKVGTKADFLAALDEATEDLGVATVTRDGDNLTVDFRSDVDPSAVLNAAVGLAEALVEIADEASTLTVGEGEDALTIILGEADSDEIIALAQKLLRGKSASQFLNDGETLTSAYTATIVYENATIELDGSLNFTVTKVGTKADFLAALDEATEDLGVATVTRDGDNLTVDFRSDVDPSAVLNAAVGLAEALVEIADEASTLTVGEGEDALTIILGEADSDEIIALAQKLLRGKSASQFLNDGETLTSAYTATIVYENATIELDGSLNFTVTKVGTKADFLAALDEATEDLGVATVTRDGDNLTVDFRSDVDPSAVLNAAVGLAEALVEIADEASTLTVGEGEDALTIILGEADSDEIIALAQKLLRGKSASQFLNDGETLTSAYTATIVYENATIELDGSLNFTVTKVGTKADFLAALDEATEDLGVATVTRDGDNLTVDFRSDVDPSAVLNAAVGLAEALVEIADEASTLTVGEGEDALTIILGEADSDEIIALAQKLLRGKSASQFLNDGETLTSAYTATIVYENATIELDGSLNFTVTKVGTKADFLAALDEATEDLGVATVTRDGDNLTVDFRSDVDPSAVLNAAVGLAEALVEIADEASTLTVGEGEDALTIILGEADSDEIIALAQKLLRGKSASQFLNDGETLTSAYTATIVYENATIELDGSLNFTVTKVGTKADFLAALDEATEDLGVATVTRDGDNLTVDFRSDVDPSAVLNAAVGLAEALVEIADEASTLTVGEGEDALTIILGEADSDEIIALAQKLLRGKSASQFLNDGETLTSAYTATIVYENATIELDGSLNFTVTKVGTKADFLAALDEATEDLGVATVTRDGDNLTVDFRSDVDPSAVLNAAVGLAEALVEIADEASTLTVGEGEDALTIILGEADSDEIIALAQKLLRGKSASQFLNDGETLTSAYTATIVYENATIELDGSLNFTVTKVGTKADFLAALDEATEDLGVATVTRDGDNLTVDFRSDVDPSAVLNAAVGLAEALVEIADEASTLTVGEGEDALTIILGEADSDEIIALAQKLLRGKSASQFLNDGETLTSAYTATIVYENATIELDGSLNFTVTKVGTKADFLAALDEATEDLGVATVTRDGDNLTVDFRSDVDPSAVLNAAVGLAEALVEIADEASTLTVGEGEDALTIILGEADSDEIIALAQKLLRGKSASQFLNDGETLTSAYTATIVYENATIELDGSLNFTVTKVGTKADFLAALDEATEDLGVATVTRDGDNLTVDFRSDVDPSAVLNAAVGLAEALVEIADEASTLTVGEGEDALTIILGEADSDEIIALAQKLLRGKSASQFLNDGETLTSAYTATIVYENATIELDGSLNFTVTKVGTKADFLAALDEATEDLGVATVTRDGDNLTVDFRSDVDPSAVLNAAVGLAEALVEIADEASTLTVGEGEDALTIILGEADSDEIIALAQKLLRGKSASQFLNDGETLTSAYTATIVYENATIELDGSLNFTVTKVGTKADFLAALDEATEDLGVATVTRDGDNLTVDFRSDVDPSAVLNAAVGLAEALVEIADEASTLTVGEGEDALTIILGEADSDEIIALAQKLLRGKSASQFLNDGETLTSAYTATIVYENATIELDGSLNFTVTKVGTKADFLAALDEATEDLGVATVTRDGDNLTVDFRSDVDPSAVLNAAVGLAEALVEIADEASTLTVGEGEDALTIILGEADSDEIIALAQKLLRGKSASQFLIDGAPITKDYTASIVYDGGTFGLSGTISFTAVQ